MGFQRRSGPYSASLVCDTPVCPNTINGDYTEQTLVDVARQKGWNVVLARALTMWDGLESVPHQSFCPTCAQAGRDETSAQSPGS